MLPTASLYQTNLAGQTHQGLVEDISTRSLQSVRIGEGAGKIQEGIANAFVGYEAGRESRNGSYITFVGYQAGYANRSASYGTFVGAYAGRENDQGTANVFVGYRTGEQNKGGSQCVGIGADAMRYNDSGNNSVAVGYAAGERCLDGSFNTMIGAQSGQDNRSGNYNTMAGYRSGRSAFQGNSNTYFGAYAGYSNTFGDANCFIGFRAGEALSSGNFNIAIGAYSLANATQGSSNISIGTGAATTATGSGNVFFGQNAGASNYDGDLNVIIGADAGLSNQGDKNVIIGESSAPVWEGDGNVLIGAEVSHHGTGYQNVIIGYNTASENYRTGCNNIFIGTGSDATRSNVDNAISIGTVNVSTTADTIAVGKNIENTGLNSVSLGFSINTNAQNSVLVGEALNITSATYFNDPLNIEIVALIQSDALLKFGISNILYDNGILGTPEVPYATAEFGYNTSNLYNSSTNPITNRVSVSSFNLADIMGYHTRVQGCNLFYTQSPFQTTTTVVSATTSNAPVFLYNTPMPSRAPTITADCNQPLTAYASNTHAFHSHLTFQPDASNFFIQNVFQCNVYERDYTVRVLKHAKQPYVSPTLEWLYEYPTSNLPTFQSSSNLLVLQCPQYGRLNRIHAPATDWTTPAAIAADYRPIPSAYLTPTDSCGILASETIYDATSNLYGISSNVVQTLSFPVTANDTPTLILPGSLYTDSNHAPSHWTVDQRWWMAFQYGDWAHTSNIELLSFDARFRFYSNETLYTSNQNLYIPQTTVYTIDTDNGYIFSGSNDSFYIGDTVIFQQFSPSNADYPIRFAAEPDGINDSDYTSNITYTGTAGIDGYATVLITSNTPNPLYYYASNQTGWGGSNHLLPTPYIPIQFPYEDVLFGCNAFHWYSNEEPALWNGATLTEPFQFRMTFVKDAIPFSCNISVSLYATQTALWEDTSTVLGSNVVLTAPQSTFKGWMKPASNVFIEQYPSNGILSVADEWTYHPLNPWDPIQDPMSFFLQNSNNTFKRYSYMWETQPGIYRSSNYWVQTPTIITEMSSNAVYVGSNEVTELLYHHRFFTCNIQTLDGQVSFPTTETTIPILSYDSQEGQQWIYSNVLIAHRLEIFPTLGSNTTTYIDTISNIDILIDTNDSNIIFYSNISTTEDGTYTDPYSNHIIETIGDYVTTHRHVYDSNYTVETEWQDTSNIIDAPRQLFLYQTQATYPKGTAVLTDAPEVNNGSQYRRTTQYQYRLERIYDEQRAFHPIVQTALYHSNATLTLSAASDYWLIESNVGRVSQTDASNLRQQTSNPPRLYLDAKTAWNATDTYRNATFRYTINSQPYTYTAPYYVWNNTRAPSPYQQTPLADYRNRSGSQWWEMDANYQASLVSWEASVRPTDFTPTHLYVMSLQKGYLSKDSSVVHKISMNDIATVVYQATGRYETDTIEFFYANETTAQLSGQYRQTIFLRYVPETRAETYAISHTLAHWNPLTSNVFYATVPETTTSNLYIRYDVKSGSSPLDFHRWPTKTSDALGIYAMEELNQPSVYASIKSALYAESVANQVVRHTVSYGLYGSLLNASLGLNVLDTGTLHIPMVPFYDFPQSNTSSLLEIHTLNDTTDYIHCNVFYGADSNHLEPLIDVGGTRTTDAVKFTTTRALNHGHLTHDVFAESTLASNVLDYIPYQPSQVSNETLYIQWVYKDAIVSPEYQWNLKNYWFVISPQPVVPYREIAENRTLDILDASRSVVSQGFREDVAGGQIEMASNHYTYPYHSNTLNSNIVYHTWNTVTPNIYTTPMAFVPVAYSFPVEILPPTPTVFVEQAGSVSLAPLISSSQIRFHPADSYQLNMYVETPPLYGLLRDEITDEVGAWTSNAIAEGRVVYQHLGQDTPLIDTFTVRFGTHPYDVTLASVTVEIQIARLPRLTRDREDFIYATSTSNALQTLYGLNRTLTFDTSNSGYIHTIQQSNIETLWKDVACNTIAIADLTSSNTGYKLIPDFFTVQASNESRTAYDPLSLRFSISSREDPTDVHRLTYEPLYSNLIVYDWSGSFNALASSNLLVPPTLASNTQKVEYDFQLDSPNYQDMTSLETTFTFLVEPYNDLVDSTFLTTSAKTLYDDYFNVRFYVEFLGPEDAELCRLEIQYQTVSVNDTVVPIPDSIQSTLRFNEYSLWSIVFNDGANQGFLSIYVNPNTFLANRDNQAVNLLKDVNIPIILTQLSRIRILSYADDPLNYSPATNTWTLYPSPPTEPIYKKLQLTQSSHRLYFKNVELSTKIATQDAQDVLTDTYNIALGKNIQVKGEDNICLGTNFSTLGKFSIIIGNNIGQSVNFVNQVYQSIIIGNTSFQDSIIRNITAIGSGLMNNLYAGALPNLTDQIINQFISKRPILIGNDIGPEKVDYHINVANTIMRTSIGNTSNDQIYLGNESEIVAIGYTSNEGLLGPAKLYVKGDIETQGIRIPFQRISSTGGTMTISLNTFGRGLIELASNTSPPALTLQFGSLTEHIGKEYEIILYERSLVPRSLFIDTALKFVSPRPTATTANSIDRLMFTVIDTGLALATFMSNYSY
jgi:hypothetical protein